MVSRWIFYVPRRRCKYSIKSKLWRFQRANKMFRVTLSHSQINVFFVQQCTKNHSYNGKATVKYPYQLTQNYSTQLDKFLSLSHLRSRNPFENFTDLFSKCGCHSVNISISFTLVRVQSRSGMGFQLSWLVYNGFDEQKSFNILSALYALRVGSVRVYGQPAQFFLKRQLTFFKVLKFFRFRLFSWSMGIHGIL